MIESPTPRSAPRQWIGNRRRRLFSPAAQRDRGASSAPLVPKTYDLWQSDVTATFWHGLWQVRARSTTRPQLLRSDTAFLWYRSQPPSHSTARSLFAEGILLFLSLFFFHSTFDHKRVYGRYRIIIIFFPNENARCVFYRTP